MITVHVSCSFYMPPRRPDVDIDIPSPNDFTVEYLTKQLAKQSWIVEVNGDNIDTYCTRACSKGNR